MTSLSCCRVVLCFICVAYTLNTQAQPSNPSDLHNQSLLIAQSSSVIQAPSGLALPKVASINLCTDQLVLLFAEPTQILSLSNLSHDRAGSYLYEQASLYPTSKGDSESILSLEPSLVLAGEYTTKHTVKLLRELGLRVELVPIANTLEQLYENILLVADWLGHSEKGHELVGDLRSRIAAQEKNLDTLTEPNPTAAFYDPNGYTVGYKTLRGRALQLSGWTNVAEEWGVESYGSMPLETMVRLAPDAIIDSPYSVGTYSRGQKMLAHPALRAGGLDPLVIDIPSRQTICAGPWTVEMIEMLASERAEFLLAGP